MIKNICRLLVLTICLMVFACSEVDYSDLDTFINNSGNGLRGQVDPLPEVKQYRFFTYKAFDISNPFVPRRNEQAQNVGNGIQPDLNRRKEVLETFPLESLAMVGSLEKDEAIFALIKSPEGTLHRVKAGNYLGQDFGKINEISESEVQVIEVVQDGVNEWTERANTLMLDD
jgi:type IV pilus assembly protein PilP